MFFLIFFSFAISAKCQNSLGKSDDFSRIALNTFIPENVLSDFPNVRSILKQRLDAVSSMNGMGGNEAFPRFVITGTANIVFDETIEGSPPKYVKTVEVFLSIGDGVEGVEFSSEIIEVKGVAREPGSRAKISAFSNDPTIDPVGACVGMRGSRVQAVVSELQGEKIEIIPWSEDPVTFVINALAPAVPSKVVMDEDAGRMEVIVPDDQLSLAIGRRGQNVRLASQLTGWFVDIMTEAEESEKRQEEFTERSKIFIDALDIDDVIAHLMVGEGFVTISDIAEAKIDELLSIEGFDEDIANELSDRANNFVKAEAQRVEDKLKKLKVKDDLYNFEQLNKPSILLLAENNIKTLDDLAELDSEELFNILGSTVFASEDDAGSVIMKAREHWFAEDEK